MRVDEFIPNSVKNVLQSGQSNNQVNNSSDNSNDNINFADVLEKQLSTVNDKQIDAQQTSTQFVQGDDINIENVMLSTQEAKLSLELAIQVRNKLVDAYQELNRMQL